MTVEIRPIDEASQANGGEDETSTTRHWAWRDNDLIVSLDITDEEFITEWYTRVKVNRFIEEARTILDISSETRATCQFRPEDREMLEDVPLARITAHNWYPDRCTYLEFDPEDRPWSVAWTIEEPSPTITFRGGREDIHLLVELMHKLINTDILSGGEVIDTISLTQGTIVRRLFFHEDLTEGANLNREPENDW